MLWICFRCFEVYRVLRFIVCFVVIFGNMVVCTLSMYVFAVHCDVVSCLVLLPALLSGLSEVDVFASFFIFPIFGRLVPRRVEKQKKKRMREN